MSNETGEYIEVLLNTCFGGYDISEKAISLYNKRKLAIDPTHKDVKYGFYIERYDPVLVEIYNELGTDDFSGKHAKIESVKIPEKYKKYWEMNEYDGKESVTIKFDTYLLEEIRNVVQNGQHCEQQIAAIKRLFAEELTEFRG